MTRRLAALLIVLAVAVIGSGVTSGVLLGRLTAPRAEAAGRAPVSTAPPVSTPGRGGNTAIGPAPGTPLRISARITGRAEDGLTVRFDASEPVTATVQWGAGSAVGQTVPAGTGRNGSARLTFSTTDLVTAQVQARAADGRVASSNTVTGRRLVRQVVLQVSHAALRFSARDRAAMVARFMGASATPIRPTAGPAASARPFGFKPVVVSPETVTAPLLIEVSHYPAGGAPRTGSARLLVPLPGRGSENLSFSLDVTGVAVTLDLRVIIVLR